MPGILILCFLCITSVLFAQNEDRNKRVPSAKEIINIEGIDHTVNKDATVTQEGNVTSIEGFKSNTARRIEVAEENIVYLKQHVQNLESVVERLKDVLTEEREAKSILADRVKQLENDLDKLQEKEHLRNG